MSYLIVSYCSNGVKIDDIVGYYVSSKKKEQSRGEKRTHSKQIYKINELVDLKNQCLKRHHKEEKEVTLYFYFSIWQNTTNKTKHN